MPAGEFWELESTHFQVLKVKKHYTWVIQIFFTIESNVNNLGKHNLNIFLKLVVTLYILKIVA